MNAIMIGQVVSLAAFFTAKHVLGESKSPALGLGYLCAVVPMFVAAVWERL